MLKFGAIIVIVTFAPLETLLLVLVSVDHSVGDLRLTFLFLLLCLHHLPDCLLPSRWDELFRWGGFLWPSYDIDLLGVKRHAGRLRKNSDRWLIADEWLIEIDLVLEFGRRFIRCSTMRVGRYLVLESERRSLQFRHRDFLLTCAHLCYVN